MRFVVGRRRSRLPITSAVVTCAMVASAMVASATAGAFFTFPSPAARAASSSHTRPEQIEKGRILKIFDRSVVYVVTNDDPSLADELLASVNVTQQRIVSLADWERLPAQTRPERFSAVFLINRGRLPAGDDAPRCVPETCRAEPNEVWTQVVPRAGRKAGYEVTLSAPDGAWLRQAVRDFRRRNDLPRGPQRKSVRSIAVVPFGAARADRVAEDYVAALTSSLLPHLLSGERYADASTHLDAADEVWLVDRSAPLPETASTILRTHNVAPGDTALWRERKANGRTRIVVSAPSADLLADALRRLPNPFAVSETVTVIGSARDLRQVRRIAVASVKNGTGGPELGRRLASVAAREVRSLDAFEVLERAGLSQVLAEIALDQAGITRAGDRARVRQLAAADALLIVEVTNAHGSSRYAVRQERLTPPMGRPPRRPLEPSRLKYALNVPGKENDAVLRAVSDALLKKVVGTKTNREYRDARDAYYNETLPRWRDEADRYADRCRSREIAWKETVRAEHTVEISGSLRLVDLVDGLVLWEAPFCATETADDTVGTRTVTSAGEDSQPRPADCLPDSDDVADVPDALLARAGETALRSGLQTLRVTAVLPSAAATTTSNVATGDTPAPSSIGRILDVDGDVLLVGLGAGDGLKVGDVLLLKTGGGTGAKTVRLVVTRARPRTCDATFDKTAPANQRALIATGQTVTPEGAKP